MDAKNNGEIHVCQPRQFCPDVSVYYKMAKIGQGTFGEVFKARHKTTNQIVALKKVLMENEKEGFPITALREIRMLQTLKHDHIVKLIEVCCSKATNYNHNLSTFYLVFEFCEHDLAGLLSNINIRFEKSHLKTIMKQLLEALFYIHTCKILHRDIKTSNILITKNGMLKLADFGLARAFSPNNPNKCLTNRVVTLWYRPPELLLGSRHYGPEIDMWGAGCIMAELWTRSAIMQGQNEQHQLFLISQLCGSITPESLPGVEHLELYKQMELKKGQQRRVRERLRNYVRDEYGVDVIDKMLEIDPKKRIDADNALFHKFFWVDPLPGDLGALLSKIHVSMFELHSAKRKAEAQLGLQLVPNPKRVITDNQYQDIIY